MTHTYFLWRMQCLTQTNLKACVANQLVMGLPRGSHMCHLDVGLAVFPPCIEETETQNSQTPVK